MKTVLGHIQEKDCHYIVQLLSRTPAEESSLRRLLHDPSSLLLLLDDPRLEKAIDDKSFRGSLELLFFLLIKKKLCQEGFYRRPIAFYLTQLLVQMQREEKKSPHWQVLFSLFQNLFTFSLDSEKLFTLLKKIGDRALFLSGFFPEALEKRWRTPLAKIEKVGSSSYRMASLTEQAYQSGIADTLFAISQEFPLYREALYDIAQATLPA